MNNTYSPSPFNKTIKLILLATIYVALFNTPIFYLKPFFDSSLIIDFVMEVVVILSLTILLFVILSLVPYIGILLISIFFIFGIISNFFIYNFKKGFDEGVLADLLSVEIELITGFIDVSLVISLILGFVLIYYALYRFLKFGNYGKRSLAVSVACILILAFIPKGFNSRSFGYMLTNYLPYNVVYSVVQYNKKYKQQLNRLKNKTDLSKKHSFKFTRNGSEPLFVVMIIGESMRGSIVSRENMPLMHNRKNLVFFKKARGSETSTRESIPYMLTSAKSPNVEQSLTEKSFISIFKNLGFETSWIGSQGLFGVFETSFASIALEADYLITKADIRKSYPKETHYDGHLLPFIDKRLPEYSSNNLTIMHLNGSHWRFDERLPEDFTPPFLPECKSAIPSQCSSKQLINSYNNSFYYTDMVIDKFLTKLEKKNALVIYSSDHGFSLGENGFFGNASKEPLAQKEQKDIAMFIWGSDYFMKQNPDLIEKFKNHSKKIVSQDYIFHSILDCSGVKSNYIDPALSFCK